MYKLTLSSGITSSTLPSIFTPKADVLVLTNYVNREMLGATQIKTSNLAQFNSHTDIVVKLS